MDKKKIGKLAGIFFIIMLVCTLLSRAAEGVTVARVMAEQPVTGVITHKVEAEGRIEANQVLPVYAQAEQRVNQIYVHEGQKVEAGDSLLQIDAELLGEQIQNNRQELSKLQLEIEGTSSKEAIDRKKKEIARQRAEEDYARAVENADLSVAWAEAELDKAQNRLAEYYSNQGSEDIQMEGQSENTLLDAVDGAQKALDEAVSAKEESVAAAQRALEDTCLPEAEEYTQDIKKTERQQLEAKIEKLELLAQEEGIVKAPADGTVTDIKTSVGQLTTQEAAVILSGSSGGCRFVAQIEKDQGAYLQNHMPVTLEHTVTREKAEDLVISSVKENEENSEVLDVTVSLEDNSLEIGSKAKMTAEKRSGTYALCIPVQALGEDNKGSFVYVLEEQETVLGRELTVQQVDVEVADKNDTYAALKEGSLGEGQQIVVSSDRSISGGSRVRLKES